MSDSSDTGNQHERERYWLVYLYKYDEDSRNEYLWTPIGLVEDRDVWQEWWNEVVEGDIELPEHYNDGGWWCSDRPVSVGLWEGDDGE